MIQHQPLEINLSVFPIGKISKRIFGENLGIDWEDNIIIIPSIIPSPAWDEEVFYNMIRLIGIIGLIGILSLTSIDPSFAIDRNTLFQGARVISNSNFSYNINSVNISLNSGPTLVGATDKSLPAYQQISNIVSQLELLKKQFKNRN